jgi:hypothetical protein
MNDDLFDIKKQQSMRPTVRDQDPDSRNETETKTKT